MKFKFWHEEWLPRSDCFLAAAGIMGGASLLGAGVSAYGATTAAKDQTEAQKAAIAAQEQMFGVTQQNLSPFIGAGTSAIPQLQAYLNSPNNGFTNAANINNTSNKNSPLSQLLKLTTPGASMTSTLENTPGFKFASEYGTMAADNSLAARGLAGPGGSLAKAVSDYNNGLAGTQWGNIVQGLTGAINAGTSNNLGVFNSGAAPLEGLINTGANAAAGLGNNATTVGQGIGSSLTGIGNAQAGAATSIGNSVGSAIGGIGSNISNQNILSMLSGQGGLFGSGGSSSLYGSAASGNAPTNAAISNATNQQANAYENFYGGGA